MVPIHPVSFASPPNEFLISPHNEHFSAAAFRLIVGKNVKFVITKTKLCVLFTIQKPT